MPSIAQIQAEVLAEVGDLGQNAAYHVLLPLNTTAGTFTINVNGSTTSALAYNAMPATVQAAVEALDTVGSGNVMVTGQPKGPYRLEFIGALAGQPVALPTASGAGLTPSAGLVFEFEQGAIQPRYAADVVAVWNGHADKPTLAIRKLWTKYDLLVRECSRLRTVVNMSDGQEQREASDAYKATAAERDNTKRLIDFQVGQVNNAANLTPHQGMPTAGTDALSAFHRARAPFAFRRGC